MNNDPHTFGKKDIYSQFCIKECPIGKKESKRLLEESESSIYAAWDMQTFIDYCIRNCSFEEDRVKFDKKHN